MTEPTPIRKRVDGRSKRVKLAAVMAAEVSGVVVAEKVTGIPESTIRYWASKPEFAEVRAKTRADLADEVSIVAHLAWARVAELLPTMDARDAEFAAEKATTLLQLLKGDATSRVETVTGGMDDHEREALRRILAEVVEAAG